MKHLFIINPAAGKYDHTKEYSTVIDRICGKNRADYEIAVTAAPGDAASIARTAAERGEELRIYACGGDGTLNGVVNGAVGFPNVAITHFPGGTGNDTIKIFHNVEPFHHLERLLDSEEAKLDVIRINDRYSLNIVSMGFDARVAAGVVAYKHLPLLSGYGAYALSAVVHAIKGLSQPFSVEMDGKQIVSGEQTLICVCNGRWYGGGYNPVPEAMPDDGLLDVLTVKKVNFAQFVKMIAVYKRGGYREMPAFISHHRVSSLCITAETPSVVNIDGEITQAEQAQIRVLPQAIRFFYPKGLSYGVK